MKINFMAFLEILGIGLKELVVGTVGRELPGSLFTNNPAATPGNGFIIIIIFVFVTYLDTLYVVTCCFEWHSST